MNRTPKQLVYKSVFDRCLQIGCDTLSAHERAKLTAENFEKGNYQGSTSKLIDGAVSSAKSLVKKKVR
tara:strand:+ start:3149 stop:3352 length:204 start_codon:yes stop_codon:yes gene_type:complete